MQITLLYGSRKCKMSIEAESRTARPAARLSACVQAASVQTEPRNARIDVEIICHGEPSITPRTVAAIAAKARTIPLRKKCAASERVDSAIARQPAPA
jgi:hypothetical protein